LVRYCDQIRETTESTVTLTNGETELTKDERRRR